MTKKLVSSVVMATFILTSAAGSQDGFGWASPRFFSSPAQLFLPALAANASVAVLAAVDNSYDDEFGERNTETVAMISEDDGATWSEATNISQTPGRTSNALAAAATATSAVVAWDDSSYQPCCQPRLMVARHAAGSWVTQTIELAESPSVQLFPRIAASDGRYYLIASDYSGWFFSASQDDGQAWTDGVRTPTQGVQGYGPLADVAAAGDDVSVFWLDRRDQLANHEVYRTFSSDGGATWSAAQRVTNAAQRESAPRMAAAGNTVIASWVTTTGENESLLEFSRSTDSGATWSAPATLTTLPYSLTNIYDFSVPGVMVLATNGSFEIVTAAVSRAPKRFVSTDGAEWVEAEAPPLNADFRTAAASGPFRHIAGHWNNRYGDIVYLRGGPGLEADTYSRSITLLLKRHLNASGVLEASQDHKTCEENVRVDIQRRRAGSWVTVRRPETFSLGRYRSALPDRPGSYRAKISQRERNGVVCGATTSEVVRHRH